MMMELSSVIFETKCKYFFENSAYSGCEFYNPRYAVCFVIEMALQRISSHDKPKAQAMPYALILMHIQI